MDSLDKLEAKVHRCKKCALYKTANNAVFGEGNHKTKIVFIGEAPGRAEDLSGRPFAGAAGKIFDQLLESVGLDRKDIFITNLVKHRPPNNRDPKITEIQACRVYIDEQIRLINPELIVTLGRHSMYYFLPDAKISLIHGTKQIIKTGSLRGKYFFPLYHPASALYNPNLKETLFADIKNLVKLAYDT